MVCIYCNNETQVINSRHQKRVNNVWRRRKCTVCQQVFSTIEAPDITRSLSVRTNKTSQPFLRDNLFATVYDSLKHRKSALTDATALTNTAISQLYALADEGVVDRDAITTVVETILKRFDKAAAISYKAFHP